MTALSKCGGEKPQKVLAPTVVFRSQSRRKAAKHKQSCYLSLYCLPNIY